MITLREYKKQVGKLEPPLTLCYLVKKDSVLIGKKKRGVGKGLLVGFGGKLEKGESIEEAALREVEEEAGVRVLDIKKVADVNYYFPDKSGQGNWNQNVHVFIASKWRNEPKETDEMKPKWFKKDKLPYDQMWDDSRYWTNLVLEGQTIKADFLYNNELKVVEYQLNACFDGSNL